MKLSLPVLIVLALIGVMLVMRMLQPTPQDLMMQQSEANQAWIEQQSQQMVQTNQQIMQTFQNSQHGPQIQSGYPPYTGYAQPNPQGYPQGYPQPYSQGYPQSYPQPYPDGSFRIGAVPDESSDVESDNAGSPTDPNN